MLYHGVRHTGAGCLYRLGVALLDLETAEHCLLRGDSWIFGPEAPYEREGDVGYVTFPCGYTLDADGDAHQPVLRRGRHQHGAGDRQRAARSWIGSIGRVARRKHAIMVHGPEEAHCRGALPSL